MERIWFIHSNNLVEGPFSTTEVTDNLGRWSSQSASFWCRQMKHWTPLKQWQSDFVKKAVTENQKLGRSTWYCMHGREVEGPMTLDLLIQRLKQIPSHTQVRLKPFGARIWRSVFDFKEVIELLGVDKRALPRIAIEGSVNIEQFDQNHVRPLLSIGEGGLGAGNCDFLAVGEKLRLNIHSSSLPRPFSCVGRVVYLNFRKEAGFQFLQIEASDREMIRDLVRELFQRHSSRIAA